jgi:hypothetical protein
MARALRGAFPPRQLLFEMGHGRQPAQGGELSFDKLCYSEDAPWQLRAPGYVVEEYVDF